MDWVIIGVITFALYMIMSALCRTRANRADEAFASTMGDLWYSRESGVVLCRAMRYPSIKEGEVMQAYWTIGGDFYITDDEGSLMASVRFHDPNIRSAVIDNPGQVVKHILEALAQTPHPYADDGGWR